MTRKISSLWQKFFFADVRPHNLAFMRIAVGCTLLAFWLRYVSHVPMMFSNEGPVLSFWEAQSGSLTALLTPPPVWLAWLLYAVFLWSIVGITLGYHYRSACAIAIALLSYFSLLSFHNFLASWSRLLYFTVIVLSFSGADRTFSLRMKRERGSWFAEKHIPVWPQRIIAIQLTATYLGVGMQKAFLPDWQGGEIIAYSFMNMWATPLAFAVARLDIPLVYYDILCMSVKLLHGLLPLGLWMPRYQKWAFLGGALFHISITLIMGMWWFLLLIPLYAAFVSPDRFAKAIHRYLSSPADPGVHRVTI